ncbi:MAG: F0F1 ATP synthase subunit epsilon [Syntrophomonadaceae bacterium]|nr:F0F1 ATP synthase subunit epsilon [Syntrophomonadaceae bacterium]
MSESTFMLEVVTPERIVLRDEVQLAVFPAVEGELGVMKNHAPLVAALNIGVLRYKNQDGTQRKMALSGGFVEILDNVARVLAETAEHADHIDIARAKAAKERAERRLAQRDETISHIRAEAALKRAIARLKAADALEG